MTYAGDLHPDHPDELEVHGAPRRRPAQKGYVFTFYFRDARGQVHKGWLDDERVAHSRDRRVAPNRPATWPIGTRAADGHGNEWVKIRADIYPRGVWQRGGVNAAYKKGGAKGHVWIPTHWTDSGHKVTGHWGSTAELKSLQAYEVGREDQAFIERGRAADAAWHAQRPSHNPSGLIMAERPEYGPAVYGVQDDRNVVLHDGNVINAGEINFIGRDGTIVTRGGQTYAPPPGAIPTAVDGGVIFARTLFAPTPSGPIPGAIPVPMSTVVTVPAPTGQTVVIPGAPQYGGPYDGPESPLPPGLPPGPVPPGAPGDAAALDTSPTYKGVTFRGLPSKTVFIEADHSFVANWSPNDNLVTGTWKSDGTWQVDGAPVDQTIVDPALQAAAEELAYEALLGGLS